MGEPERLPQNLVQDPARRTVTAAAARWPGVALSASRPAPNDSPQITGTYDIGSGALLWKGLAWSLGSTRSGHHGGTLWASSGVVRGGVVTSDTDATSHIGLDSAHFPHPLGHCLSSGLTVGTVGARLHGAVWPGSHIHEESPVRILGVSSSVAILPLTVGNSGLAFFFFPF